MKQYKVYENFSEFAKSLPESKFTRLASKIAKAWVKEIDRRIAENGMMTRPWDYEKE